MSEALQTTVLDAIEAHYGDRVFVLDDMLAVLTDLAAMSIAGIDCPAERGRIVYHLVHALIANIETRVVSGDFIEMIHKPGTLQ